MLCPVIMSAMKPCVYNLPNTGPSEPAKGGMHLRVFPIEVDNIDSSVHIRTFACFVHNRQTILERLKNTLITKPGSRLLFPGLILMFSK